MGPVASAGARCLICAAERALASEGPTAPPSLDLAKGLDENELREDAGWYRCCRLPEEQHAQDWLDLPQAVVATITEALIRAELLHGVSANIKDIDPIPAPEAQSEWILRAAESDAKPDILLSAAGATTVDERGRRVSVRCAPDSQKTTRPLIGLSAGRRSGAQSRSASPVCAPWMALTLASGRVYRLFSVAGVGGRGEHRIVG